MNHIFLTVDLGFGDAGKGSVVDFLTRRYAAHTVVRYNGGAQAGHRVVTPGLQTQEHVFAQFGAGTLAGAATHLSRHMLIDPLAMQAEELHLRELGVLDAFARTTIDDRALVITPFQRAVNRLKELARGDARHGSCGLGIGETMADYLAYGAQVLFAGDLGNAKRLRDKLQFLHEVSLAKLQTLALPNSAAVAHERELLDDDWADWLIESYLDFARQACIVAGDYLHRLLKQPGTVIFEGAQGVLLDEWHGFHPHTTWSTTTLANADQLLREASVSSAITRIGITRAYATRHGAGPFVSEDAALTRALPDARNGLHTWQQNFRVGWLDLVLLRYACEVVGPLDYLAITCLDRLAALPALKVCRGYECDSTLLDCLAPSPTPRDLAYQERLTHMLARCRPLLEDIAHPATLLDRISQDLGLRIGLTSHGPSAAEKQCVTL